MIGTKWLLYIEPKAPVSDAPVIDDLTRRMTAAFRGATRPGELDGWMGVHQCACGASSSTYDHKLPDGQTTNSLCIHYLALHRAEISQEQIARVQALTSGEAVPTDREIAGNAYTEYASNHG